MRALFVRYGALGDVVRAIPAARLVKDSGFEVFWLTRRIFKPLLAREGFVPFALNELPKFRRLRFSAVFDLQGLLKSAISGLFFKTDVFIGPSRFSGLREPSFFLYRHQVPVDPRLNRVFRNVYLVVSSGLVSKRVPLRLGLTLGERELEEARKLLGSTYKRGFVVMHPGSSPSTPYKRWGEERFSRLSEMVYKELSLRVVLTHGDAYEEGICRKVISLSKAPVTVLPRMSLTVLSALFSLSAAFVGNDTGPLHLASLSGCPTVGVFGPTDVSVNGPVGKRATVAYVGAPCSPCRNRKCAVKKCFDPVTPEFVFRKLLEVI